MNPNGKRIGLSRLFTCAQSATGFSCVLNETDIRSVQVHDDVLPGSQRGAWDLTPTALGRLYRPQARAEIQGECYAELSRSTGRIASE